MERRHRETISDAEAAPRIQPTRKQRAREVPSLPAEQPEQPRRLGDRTGRRPERSEEFGGRQTRGVASSIPPNLPRAREHLRLEGEKEKRGFR